jgi:hypothetical protein
VAVCREWIMVRICQNCVRHAEREHFPDPVVAMADTKVTLWKAPVGAVLGEWPLV